MGVRANRVFLLTFIAGIIEAFTSRELGQEAWVVNGQTCSVFLGARDSSDTAKFEHSNIEKDYPQTPELLLWLCTYIKDDWYSSERI